MSYGVKLKVWGDYACFTRPEMKVERVSYDVMTPSAARGILEAIYWKPEIRWVVDRIHVLKPIRFTNIRRNEVSKKASASNAGKETKSGESKSGFYIEESRQQRAALVLRDVAYIIEAHFDVLGGKDGPEKHIDMFRRRALKGQVFHQPYLGCREFAAKFELVTEEIPQSPHKGVKNLGFILHDIDFKSDMKPGFFRAEMRDGVIDIPCFDSSEVRS